EADEISLTDDLHLVRVETLTITLTPLPVNGGRPALTASRWEVRKALLSLCSVEPSKLEVEVTRASATVRVSFYAREATEELSRKLHGVAVYIAGIKLRAAKEESESAALCEGSDWETDLLSRGLSERGRQETFSRLAPGHRPDTIVLRGIPANWLGEGGRAAEGTSAQGLVKAMSRLGHVRCVEVAPSAAATGGNTSPSLSSMHLSKGQQLNNSRPRNRRGGTWGGAGSLGPGDLSVDALLAGLGPPGSSAKGFGGGGAGTATAGTGVDVGLNVDAWVQFSSLSGLERAVKTFRGRVLRMNGADMVCEYRVGVDMGGFMSDKLQKSRAEARRKEAEEVR
ncbi:unnamed protein product, partial [Choristocarpus tenellus]